MKNRFIENCNINNINGLLLNDLSETAWDIIETIYKTYILKDFDEFFKECINSKFNNVYDKIHYYDKEEDDFDNLKNVFKLELENMDIIFELLKKSNNFK